MANVTRKQRRDTFIQALLNGATVAGAAKIAGVDMRQALLWAGADDVKAVLQPNKRHQPVTYFGSNERIENV